MMKLFVITVLSGLIGFSSSAQASSKNAAEYAEAGWNFLYFSEYDAAEGMFAKAVDANKRDHTHKIPYARALLKNNKQSQAREVLSGWSRRSMNDEREFLIAVSYFEEDQFEESRPRFEKIVAKKNKFSSQAQDYLDAEKTYAKRYTVNGTFGLMFDSRVIDEDLVANAGESDGRIFIASDITYRYKKTRIGEMSLRAALANFFSFDKNHSLADPLKIDLQAQFKKRYEFRGKKYDTMFTPGLELVWLDADNDGSRKPLYFAPVARLFAAEERKGNRQHNYYGRVLWYASTDSTLSDTSSDLSGLNLNGGWKMVNFLSGTQKFWMTDAYLDINFVSGDALKRYRLGGSYAYMMPWKKFHVGLIGESRLSLFPSSNNVDGASRKDLYLSGGALARRSLKEWLGASAPQWLEKDWLHVEGRAALAFNISNTTARSYNRIVLGAFLNGRWRF